MIVGCLGSLLLGAPATGSSVDTADFGNRAGLALSAASIGKTTAEIVSSHLVQNGGRPYHWRGITVWVSEGAAQRLLVRPSGPQVVGSTSTCADSNRVQLKTLMSSDGADSNTDKSSTKLHIEQCGSTSGLDVYIEEVPLQADFDTFGAELAKAATRSAKPAGAIKAVKLAPAKGAATVTFDNAGPGSLKKLSVKGKSRPSLSYFPG